MKKISGDNNKNVISEIVLIDGIPCNHVHISLASNKHSRLCMNDNLIISISLNLPIVNTLSYFNRNPPIPYYFVVLAAVSLV